MQDNTKMSDFSFDYLNQFLDKNTKEMPKYQSHKKVWALKIKEILFIERDVKQMPVQGFGAMITPEDEGYGSFEVDGFYMTKHKPQKGGYYVVYEDGYKSWSPAEAFEGGYTKII